MLEYQILQLTALPAIVVLAILKQVLIKFFRFTSLAYFFAVYIRHTRILQILKKRPASIQPMLAGPFICK